MEKAVTEVFAPFEERGLLDKLDQSLGPGNQEEIVVYPKGHPNLRQVVQVSDVLIGDGTALREALRRRGEIADVADRLFDWLLPRLKPTLRVDPALTKQNMDQAEADVGEVMTQYSAGQTLAKAGQPLKGEQVDLLGLEYAAAMRLRHSERIGEMIARALAVTALVFVILVLCGIYMRYRQRGPLASLTRLLMLLLLAVAAVAAGPLARGRSPGAASWFPCCCSA